LEEDLMEAAVVVFSKTKTKKQAFNAKQLVA
jgi:hypothetical protein